MPLTNKKPRFGTISVVALFLVMFLLPAALFLRLLSQHASQSSSRFDGLFFAVFLVPIVLFFAIAGLILAYASTKALRNTTMPDNHTATLVTRGLITLVPAWIIGLLLRPDNPGPEPNLQIPAMISAATQISLLVGLGVLGKSVDKTRRTVWSLILCGFLLITPIIVLKISTNY